MPDRNIQPLAHTGRTTRIAACACLAIGLAFALTFVFLPLHASARTVSAHAPSAGSTFHTNTTAGPRQAAGGPTLQVNVGFDSRFRDGNWVPIQVALANDGADFNGIISLAVPLPYLNSGGSSSNTSSSIYQQTVSLPGGAQKQVTMYVPLNLGAQGITQNITVNLLDTNNHIVRSQAASLRTLGPSDIFIGLLSDQPTSGFGPLSTLSLPDQTASVIIQPLNASNIPTVSDALKNFDMIMLDGFTTSSLSKEQITALHDWVNEGGKLLEIGGPTWRSTLTPLPTNLLPVTLTGSDVIPANTHLLPLHGISKGKAKPAQSSDMSDTVSSPILISTSTANAKSTTLLSSNGVPLIVQKQLGQGQIYYFAYDPTLDPILSWSGSSMLWKTILVRSLGDQILQASASSSYDDASRSTLASNGVALQGILQSLFPNTFLATRLILILSIGYLLILGPIRFLIVRRFKSRDWSWRIALSTIVVFSLLSYGLALQQKGTSIVSSSISLIRLDYPDSDGSMAHVTTYTGVFVPNQGDFQVHIPGFNLVQPAASRSSGQNQSGFQPTTFTTTPTGVDVNLRGVNIWTTRTLVAQTHYQTHGGIFSNLTLQQNILTGTVTNTLPYPLRDVYLLASGHFVPLDYLQPGQTRTLHLALQGDANNSTGTSLADQIALSHGLPIPYGPSFSTLQTLSELQRHMAMLAAVSGEISYDCNPGPCVQTGNGNNLNITGNIGYQLANGNDPLLLSNAPATLIGWADHMADSVGNTTINGIYTSKVQEALVQAPLQVGINDPISLTSPLVHTQLIDVQSQGSNIQTLFSGIYALTSGNMTFDFTLPGVTNLHAKSLAINLPSNLSQFNIGLQGTATDANSLQAFLYNWHTGTWDTFNFTAYSFSTNTPDQYIGPDGHILLQLAAPAGSQGGTIIFGKPSLEIDGGSSSS